MEKTVISIFLAVVLLISILPMGAFATSDGKLSALKFTAGTSNTSQIHTMIPDFDPEIKEYTIIVPDSTSSVAIWATLDSASSGSIKAAYTKTNGTAGSVSVTSGKTTGASLSSFVSASKLTGNTVDITIDGETAYTVKVVRQATLSKLSVKVGENDVTLSPAFNSTKYEYSASVPNGATLSITPTVKSTGATFTVNGTNQTEIKPEWNGLNSSFEVKVKGDETTKESTYIVSLSQLAEKIEIVAPPTKTEYAAGETFDTTGFKVKATYSDNSTKEVSIDDLAVDPAGPIYPGTKDVTVTFEGQSAKQSITVEKVFDGSGAKEDPFLIKTANDLVNIGNLILKGLSFEGYYFKMVNDITLPDTEGDDAWVPLGKNKANPFSGNIDGNNKLLTVPEGGLPLIGFPANASLLNLNVYGGQIKGFGVVNGYGVGNTNVPAITIDNVTLKSGTQTLKSGFIGGYASGSNTVVIKNSTVEKDVVIGYDKSQKWVGSFGGEFNGTIENCVSYATVYGTDFVGGIVADKGQTMGDFNVLNCKFYGEVVAGGNYVGGIVGHGYAGTQWGISSAPNAPCTTIKDSICYGNVTGADYVGGVLGGETGVAQAWENGIGYLKNNYFLGKVTATNGTNIGGIVGYYRSLNKYTQIENNYFSEDCGAEKGIGGVEFVDTNNSNHETVSGATYLNTESGISECPKISGCNWKKEHNRTDDPLGADAEKLTKNIDSAITDVILNIDSIGKVTLDSADAIKSARDAYNALSDEQKQLVVNYVVLESAEEAYKKLVEAEKEEDDKPDDNKKPGNEEKPGESQNPIDTEKNEDSVNTESPRTGDYNNIFLYFAVIFACGCLLAGCTVRFSKNTVKK